MPFTLSIDSIYKFSLVTGLIFIFVPFFLINQSQSNINSEVNSLWNDTINRNDKVLEKILVIPSYPYELSEKIADKYFQIRVNDLKLQQYRFMTSLFIMPIIQNIGIWILMWSLWNWYFKLQIYSDTNFSKKQINDDDVNRMKTKIKPLIFLGIIAGLGYATGAIYTIVVNMPK